MIVIGGNRFGKTDHLPGMFYVVTDFLHVYYLPLIPFTSYVIEDGTDEKAGVKIGISGKSVLLAYLRGWFGIVGALVTAGYLLALFFSKNDPNDPPDIPFRIVFGSILASGWLLLWISYRWQKPSPVRALYLAKKLGIPMEAIVEHYVDDPRIEEMVMQSQLNAIERNRDE